MDHLVNVEDSYAERRQLFKNVWDTAMKVDTKNADNKPKVIKTLRLDEVDRSSTIKKKKLKWKHLRTVCNKILDYCDNQDIDNIIYEEIKARNQPTYLHIKHKKVKRARLKRKVKKSRSLSSPTGDPTQPKMISERNDEFNDETNENLSPSKPANVTQLRSPRNTSALSKPNTRRDMIKKYNKKRKKSLS